MGSILTLDNQCQNRIGSLDTRVGELVVGVGKKPMHLVSEVLSRETVFSLYRLDGAMLLVGHLL